MAAAHELSRVATAPVSRRERAAATVSAALRSGVLAAIAATIAWLLAGAIAATAFLVLLVATLAVAAWAVLRDGRVPPIVWLALAAGWAIVLLERWAVQSHGGLWVAAAAWLGVVLGARRAGIRPRSQILLAYPLLSLAIVIAAGEDVLDPWGVSWLWVAAVLGPVLGARTLLAPGTRAAS
jgi:hypothetical protein